MSWTHGKGRIHINDFAERNVVVRNGKYRLIDFHDVEGHECDYQEGVEWPGEFFLDAQSDFPCDTLAELAEEMHIWRTSEYFVCQLLTESAIKKTKSRSSRSMAEPFARTGYRRRTSLTSSYRTNFVGAPQNWGWAETYLKQVWEEMDEDPDSFDLDALIARRQRPPLH